MAAWSDVPRATIATKGGSAARIASAAAATSGRPSARNRATTAGIASISRLISVGPGDPSCGASAIREEARQPAAVRREDRLEQLGRAIRVAGERVGPERLQGNRPIAAARRRDGQAFVALDAPDQVRLLHRQRRL